jgi:hypothetical protein
LRGKRATDSYWARYTGWGPVTAPLAAGYAFRGVAGRGSPKEVRLSARSAVPDDRGRPGLLNTLFPPAADPATGG